MTSFSSEQAISIGLAHHQSGRLEQAEAVYRQVLANDPQNATALNLLGALAIQSGRAAMAVDLLRRAIASNPQVANYHSNLGEALRRLGQLAAAVAAYRAALALKPDLAVAHNNLGIALGGLGDRPAAIAAFESAVRYQAAYAEAHNNLGNALKDSGRFDAAAVACRVAVKLKPDWPDAWVSLGVALAGSGSHDEAVEAYRTAIARDPHHAAAHSNLGNALAALGRWREALTACESAVALDPQSIQAHWNYAVALLRAGDFARGWLEYEWRWRVPSPDRRQFDRPMWNGSDLAGRTILLHAEQGFGDTIQFARYAPLVAATRCTVLLEAPPSLVRLLGSLPGVGTVIPRGDPLPPFDEHAPLMSLPGIMRTRDEESVPRDVPYLSAQGCDVRRWRETIGERGGKLHVGLAFAGTPAHSNDCNRSIAPHLLNTLAVPGVIFHSIQNAEPGRASLTPDSAISVIDHSADLADFADTAALLAHLDLVITVDTAVAHLAGAMGMETWLLLPFSADWRWLVDRDDSPWYPSMRLFRQRTAGDWGVVLQGCATALRSRAAHAQRARPGRTPTELNDGR